MPAPDRAPFRPAAAAAPRSDRNAFVDRERAQGNINAGLLAASLALGSFALTFVAAIFYIGL